MGTATERKVGRITDGTVVEVTRGWCKGLRGTIEELTITPDPGGRWTYKVRLSDDEALYVDGEFIKEC